MFGVTGGIDAETTNGIAEITITLKNRMNLLFIMLAQAPLPIIMPPGHPV
jgi:hypothetical protein